MGYGAKSAIPHGRYDYEKEYALLDLVFIWLKEHSLIVLLLLGTIFNVFWLYRMRRQLQMKWYAVLILSVLHKSTLTITNKKSTTATLSFDYSIEQNSGKIQVDGTEVSSGASFTKELATNESVKVYIQSGSTSAATKITLTNVVLVSDVNATATFVPAENGSYSVEL